MIDADEYKELSFKARYGEEVSPFARLFDAPDVCEMLSGYLDQHVLRAAERGSYEIAISGIQIKRAIEDMVDYEKDCVKVLERAGSLEQARAAHPLAYVQRDTGRRALGYIIDRLIEYLRSEYDYWQVDRFEGNELGILIEP